MLSDLGSDHWGYSRHLERVGDRLSPRAGAPIRSGHRDRPDLASPNLLAAATFVRYHDEAIRRAERVEDGQVKTIDGEEAVRQLQAKLRNANHNR
jgi:hypothetical protein